MTTADYFRVLELHRDCSEDDIKKAYRKKAREYHPDINHSADAKDMFILATEAYEFLIANFQRVRRDAEAYDRAMDEWRKYRQRRARYRARVYSRTTYAKFRNTNFYKTTRIFDGTTIILSVMVAVSVLLVAVTGYFYRLHHPIPGEEDPTITVLALFILLGMVLFIISMIFLKAYLQTSQKKGKSDEGDC